MKVGVADGRVCAIPPLQMTLTPLQATSPRGWLKAKNIVSEERPLVPRAFQVEGSLRCRRAEQATSRTHGDAVGLRGTTGEGFGDDRGLRDQMTASIRSFSRARVGQGFRGATSQVISFALSPVT